jgi:hypothetical protein
MYAWCCWAGVACCWVMRPDTMGIWGGGKEVEAAVVSDERRWKEVGVEARRSE